MGRTLRRVIAIGMVGAGLALAAWVASQRLAAPKATAGHDLPRGRWSFLLVTIDTTNPHHLEPYGATNVETPTLARLADEGIVFEQAFAVAPLTLVAHTSIHSGLYPPRHGVRNNGIHHVPDEVETLAERLAGRGYRTGAFVSAAVLDSRYHLDQGFEVYDDDLSSGRERLPRMVPDRPAGATVASATAWLDSLPADAPFFCWVHLYDPHAAYNPPPPFRDTYRERLYDGEIAYMDAQLGRLLEHPRLADRDHLMVMVVGDHGESLGEHGEQTHGILAYDSTLHVAWILDLPGGPQGLRVARPVSQVDLVPTALDLLRAPAAEGLDGLDLVPILAGRERSPEGERSLYAESYLPFYTYGWAKLHVLRRGALKYVDAPSPELYDTARDPQELTNLVDELPNQAHDLRRDLEALEASFGAGEREATLAITSDAAEQLRALGYLAAGSGRVEVAEGARPDPKEVIGLHVGMERARQLAMNRMYDRAVAQLDAVLERDPNNLAALVDLATDLQAAGELERAAEVTERALGLDPDYPRLYLVMAGIEGQRGRPGKALELVDRALALDPGLSEAVIRRAMLLARLGRRAEVETTLAEALDRNPDEPSLEIAFAQMVELQRGELEAAEQRVRAALARDPFLTRGWQVLGGVLERANRNREAVDAFQQGLRRRPDDAELHAACGLLLARLGERRTARVHLEEAIRLGAGFRSELHVSLGALLAEEGRYDEAEQQYALVLEREPHNPAARNNRAIALYRSGRYDEAERELRELVAAHPAYADAFNTLAAVELNPEAVEAWNNLGIALDELGRLEEARSSLERALALDDGYWPARLNLGLALRRLGEARAAADALERVLESEPTQPVALLELGDLFAGPLADPTRARLHYNAFLRAAPRHPRAAEIRATLAAMPPE